MTSQMAEGLRLAREVAAGKMVLHRAAEATRDESAGNVLAGYSAQAGELQRAFDALDTYGGGIPAVKGDA